VLPTSIRERGLKPSLAGSPQVRSGQWPSEPGPRELVCLVLLTAVVFVFPIAVSRSYFSQVDNFGDNSAYMSVASAIRHWNFAGLQVEQFWGYPYVIAVVSLVFHVSERSALLFVSFVSSFLAVFLAQRLWGGWVAGFFAVINFDWMQRSFLGGSEPLFVALLFGAFLAARKERWIIATALAACATTVRPLGIIALFSIGLALLWRRNLFKLCIATMIGLAVGTLYVLPLTLYFGSPLANVHAYNPHNAIFGIPFHAIIKGTILYSTPWTNLLLTSGWILFVFAGNVAMFTNANYRAYASKFPVEAMFAVLYLLAVYCYNYPFWARGTFARFVIPALPFVLAALLRWLPKDRRVLWPLALLFSLLAAASTLGIRNVFHRLY
jgi:hypothetical protein